METISSMKQNTKKVKRDLVEFSLKRNPIDGLTLKIKSPMFANFFKEQTEIDDDSFKVVQHTQTGESITDYPRIKRIENISRSNRFFSNFYEWDNRLTNSNGNVNLAFLRACGIGDGITVNINGRYSAEAMQFFKTEFKEAVQGFYMDTMRAINTNCKVSVIDEVIE